MDYLVSIIIPIYMTESFLSMCVESVLAQTYRNLEIILVDDGSPDDCPVICDKYAEKYSKIRVIHKVNGGVSSARNAGLDVASGRYVCFVDSDDYLSLQSVEILVDAISNSASQYAAGVCGYLNSNRVKCDIPYIECINVKENPEKFLTYLCSHGSYSPYAKIFDLSIIKENRLRFKESHKCSEDSLFIRQYMKFCKNICLTPHVVYYYNTENENSLSKKKYEDYCRYYADKLQALKELTDGLCMDQDKKNCFLSQRAIHGLKISLSHYFNNWQNKKKRMDFVNLVVEVLVPWIVDEYPQISDRRLARWWKYSRKSILRADIKHIYQSEYMRNIVFRIRHFPNTVRKLLNKNYNV